eukprot:gnl/Chilomastix_caulleri/2532.p1 GENE.gnl/Chilomastix_caulleri/2532~~gnl/Chilomastix_caulleri/2532.p1  ORF type:complete len:63 (+),score=13.42 gnl/Chilomastix_caulleri/2532:237-425(+)
MAIHMAGSDYGICLAIDIGVNVKSVSTRHGSGDFICFPNNNNQPSSELEHNYAGLPKSLAPP